MGTWEMATKARKQKKRKYEESEDDYAWSDDDNTSSEYSAWSDNESVESPPPQRRKKRKLNKENTTNKKTQTKENEAKSKLKLKLKDIIATIDSFKATQLKEMLRNLKSLRSIDGAAIFENVSLSGKKSELLEKVKKNVNLVYAGRIQRYQTIYKEKSVFDGW